MADKGPGCRKVTAVGCLGLLALVVLVGLVSWIWAWAIGRGDHVVDGRVDAPRASAVRSAPAEGWYVGAAPPEAFTPPAGRIELDLQQGAFFVRPGPPGEPTRIEATYDEQLYELTEELVREEDRWVFRVGFRRTAPALVAFMRAAMGDEEPRVDVYLSPDDPIELAIRARRAGLDAELGGLWLTRAELSFEQGGGRVRISEPLREPMDTFSVRNEMGGCEVSGLAMAAPRAVRVSCRMGGAELDLDGDWYRSADFELDVTMGGIEVDLPRGVDVEGLGRRRGRDARLETDSDEVPTPTLRFDVSSRMGEIEAR